MKNRGYVGISHREVKNCISLWVSTSLLPPGLGLLEEWGY